MFELKAENLLCGLWDAMRPRNPNRHLHFVDAPPFGVEEEGLLITLDLSLDYYDMSCEEFHASALVHTLFTANTSVFTAISRDHEAWNRLPMKAFENPSNHDSCWRSDGMMPLQALYATMCDEINAERVKTRFGTKLAPKEFSQFCLLGHLGSEPFQKVLVHHERTPGDSYRRHVISIKPLEGL